MKTKEFIERVESIGYKTVKTDWYINIYDKYNITEQVASVNIYAERQLSISNAFYDLTKLIIEYADTPLDEREDYKKYYVNFTPDNSRYGYLNFRCDTGLYSVHSIENVGGSYKTEFTQSEIDKLKQRKDIPIDWDTVTLEEVEDE